METKERPIIFGTWAIPKLQDGSKTQTRRTKGLKKINESPNDWVYQGRDLALNHYYFYHRDYVEHKSGDAQMLTIKCPYGQVGDRLWVKENLRWSKVGTPTRYSADDCPVFRDGETPWVWPFRTEVLPSIFMPRWASRITLEITDIRAERLQDISREDVATEGCPWQRGDGPWDDVKQAKEWFTNLWDSINGKKYPWDSNPWVWVISFRKEEG